MTCSTIDVLALVKRAGSEVAQRRFGADTDPTLCDAMRSTSAIATPEKSRGWRAPEELVGVRVRPPRFSPAFASSRNRQQLCPFFIGFSPSSLFPRPPAFATIRVDFVAPTRFTAERFRWLDQVLADRHLTPLAFKCAYVLARFMNRSTMDAWPGQDRLATECGVTRNGICKVITALCERGRLSVTPGKWRGITSRYIWEFRNGSSDQAERFGNVTPFPTKGQQASPFRG
jgi:hypothetical protein